MIDGSISPVKTNPVNDTGVSSSISSTGTRLPLETQLIGGSLFRVWITL
jgi:hypothetical protein